MTDMIKMGATKEEHEVKVNNRDKMENMNGADMPDGLEQSQVSRITRVLSVDISKVGVFTYSTKENSLLKDWEISLDESTRDAAHLIEAARHLRETDLPVAFPTETVYGLGADATRSAAVRGIYAAKRRPIDNPLIVHVCSLDQLRGLLQPQSPKGSKFLANGHTNGVQDPIPKIYYTLIQRFWPGPLTILLPNPPNSLLASEVTAGLPTFGARMPASPLALALIKIANVPLAAPSANASTKPSPTTAQHVKHDLDGRIDIILDGGSCDVGVESTVVDGLSDPPCILRPGGISIEQLRACPGWENTTIAYKDGAQPGTAPRAPGMKYKHYSPKAKVVLVEAGAASEMLDRDLVHNHLHDTFSRMGVLRTRRWKPFRGDQPPSPPTKTPPEPILSPTSSEPSATPPTNAIPVTNPIPSATFSSHTIFSASGLRRTVDIWDINLGGATADIARGLFAALRELDRKDVGVIFVEGIDDAEGDAAAAVMNRLRKAAEVEVR